MSVHARLVRAGLQKTRDLTCRWFVCLVVFFVVDFFIVFFLALLGSGLEKLLGFRQLVDCSANRSL